MTQPNTRPGRLHYELSRGPVETCSIPSPDELQARPGCSTSEERDRAFEGLAELHGIVLHPPSRDGQPVASVFERAKRWYGEHLRPDRRNKSIAEAHAIFADLEFTQPVWLVPSEEGRF